MRISDWSSDVCYSDLTNEIVVAFTGMPEQEVAGSIWRRTVFAVGKYPTVASVIDALTQKYGEPHIGQTESGYYSMSHRTGATNLNWIFAANSGRIGNDDRLKHRCVQIGRASCRERVCQYV